MILSSKTLEALKNYYQINNSIKIEKGNVIRTISPMKQIYSECVVEEEFPHDFVIYDLGKFLNVLNMFDEPVIEFNENYLEIIGGDQKAKIVYGNEDVIIVPPKNIKLPPNDYEIDINVDILKKINKAMSIIGVDKFVIESDGDGVYMKTYGEDKKIGDEFEINLGAHCDVEFSMVVKADNLKVLPYDYTFGIMFFGDGVISLMNDDIGIKYIITCEENSKFNRS